MPDRAAHTLRPPSALPANQRSCPGCAPGRWPLAHPDLLPVLADNAPTDWPAGSVRHNSTPRLQTRRPLHPVSSRLAFQITHARVARADTPLLSRSTHTTTEIALLQATLPAHSIVWTDRSPKPLPKIPALGACTDRRAALWKHLPALRG